VASARPEGENHIPSGRQMAVILIGWVGFLAAIQILYLWFVISRPDGWFTTDFDSDQMAHLGNFGASFGGISAFFTGLGFAGIVTTIYFQHKELSNHHRESESRSEELKHQLDLLNKSTEAQNELTRSQIYQNAKMPLDYITQYFIEHPEDKPYFYSGKDFPRQDPDFTRLYTLAELFVDAIDNLLVNKENAPDALDWTGWPTFFHDVYQRSPIMQRYYREHTAWYGKDMYNMLEENRAT
jgi:hypothetical protein